MSFHKISVVFKHQVPEELSEIKRRIKEAVQPNTVLDISSRKYTNLRYLKETYDI